MKKPPLKTPGFFGAAAFIVAVLSLATPVEAAWAPDLFGTHASDGISPESAAAMFLVGLSVGVALGIALFFGYLMWRQRRESQHDRDLERLLDDISDSRSTADDGVWGRGTAGRRGETHDQPRGEIAEERLDPWERPADWWRDT